MKLKETIRRLKKCGFVEVPASRHVTLVKGEHRVAFHYGNKPKSHRISYRRQVVRRAEEGYYD